MATFADLMSLLMCFFVLLLSFSEMDVEKFKQIAGSMAFAFGVQNQVQVEDIPKGTSVIAMEFSPGETTQSPIETIQQVTDQNLEQSLRVGQGTSEGDRSGDIMEELSDEQMQEQLQKKIAALLGETEADAEKLKDMLQDEVQTGKVDVESDGRTITVRIREQGSFPSGSAELAASFVPVMQRIRDALIEIPGTVSVEGHTDDVPTRGGRYESNWGLSSSRALSVTHELLRDDLLDDSRMMVVGFADTKPFTSNETPDGRASNRRVEIVIRQGIDAADSSEIEALRDVDPEALELLGID